MKEPLKPKRKSRNPSQLQQRLKMLANGWFPIPCEGKSWMPENWPHFHLTETLIRAWDGYGKGGCKLKGTGTRVEGSMLVLDLDIGDETIMKAVLDALQADEVFSEWMYDALWRNSGATSLALFGQVSEPVGGRHSAIFGSVDADGGVVTKVHVETYGGATHGKYFACFGPHARPGREYAWDGGSPVDRRLDSLPVLPAGEIGRLHDLIEATFAQCGLTHITAARALDGLRNVYTLTDDTEFWLEDGTMTTCRALQGELDIGPENGRRGCLTYEDWQASESKARCNAFRREADGRLMITDFSIDVNYYWADEKKPDPVEIDKDDVAREALNRLRQEAGQSRAKPNSGEPAEEPEPEPEPPESFRLENIPRSDDPIQTYATATLWLLKNVAFWPHAFSGRGGIVSIYPDGEYQRPVTIAALKASLSIYGYESVGPRGGTKQHNPVDYWMKLPDRVEIYGIRMRPELPRPLMRDESGLLCLNRYQPPVHPTTGGSIDVFVTRLNGLVPNPVERWWVWNFLACLIQHPEWRMIALAMLARDMGSGRGLFAEVLHLLLGERFVAGIPYSSITGATRFNAEVVDKLLIYVNEAHDSEQHKFHNRNAAKEALKVFIEPNHRLPYRVEPKGVDAYFTRASVSTLIFTNNIDGLPIGESDRRVAIVLNGPQMTPIECDEFQAWMLKPKNIGALYRHLRAFAIEQDRSKFDPYRAPEFRGRDLMIEVGKTAIDHAWEAAIAKLASTTELATMSQIVVMTRYYLKTRQSDHDDLIRKHTEVNAYRIGEKRPTNHLWLIRYGNDEDNRERVYAFNEADRVKWSAPNLTPADIKPQLDLAQKVVDAPSLRFSKYLHTVRNDEESGEKE
jgi:Family of unknown function (DUF5906)